MFANPKWFSRRKWGGWGVYPKTKEGWFYIMGILLPVIILSLFPVPEDTKSLWIFVWTILVVLDVIVIMIRIREDEMETKMEAMAERNAAWAIVFVIGAGIAYQAFKSAYTGKVYVDPFLIAALFIGLLAKVATHLYYRNKGL